MSEDVSWVNVTRVEANVGNSEWLWLQEHCLNSYFAETYNQTEGKIIFAFARSADALAFRLAFPTRFVKNEV